MNLKSIETLIELKDNESVEIGVVYAQFEDNRLTVQNCIVYDFEELTSIFIAEISAVSIALVSTFKNEIKKDIKNCETNDLLKIEIKPSDKGFKVNLNSYYLNKYMSDIRDEHFRINIDELVSSIKVLESDIEEHINERISNYLELKEVGKIKEYILLYENGRDISRYDFVRLTDRPISQQKVEIQELIDSGLTGKIYDDIIEDNPELIDKKLSVSFTLVNDNEVRDIRVSTF